LTALGPLLYKEVMKITNTEEFEFSKKQLITLLKNSKSNKKWSKEKIIALLKNKGEDDGSINKSSDND
jgi:hypothetical protein